MKEITFIGKNEAKWKTLESFAKGGLKMKPDQLAAYYIEVVDDLSYAKTFYPKSSIVKYLNNLSSKAHQKIYVTKKEDKSRFKTFWTQEIPLAIRESQKELLLAALIFIIFIAVGAVSTYIDQDFSRVILGDQYVDMTLNNIEDGDPMGVYRDDNKSLMFIGLGVNNMKVGLLSYTLGLVSPVFSAVILVANGVMVGVFQGFFVRHGLLWESFSTIFLHGALELSAIVIFGGAGIIIGNGWWFPGTYSRLDSFILATKRSVKVLIAVMPIIIVAAFIEAFVTHLYQDMSGFVRGLIILLSFLYIFWYFGYYPYLVEKRLQNKKVVVK